MKKIERTLIENRVGYFMSKEEEEEFYQETLRRIIHNPRFYLDNLDDLHVFRLSSVEYKAEKVPEIETFIKES